MAVLEVLSVLGALSAVAGSPHGQSTIDSNIYLRIRRFCYVADRPQETTLTLEPLEQRLMAVLGVLSVLGALPAVAGSPHDQSTSDSNAYLRIQRFCFVAG
eukprot:4828594-Karenia_brevis.AAC.1